MIKFLVVVTCISTAKVCPIPQGYKSLFPARDKLTCELRAKEVIKAFGYKLKDFVIVCERQ